MAHSPEPWRVEKLSAKYVELRDANNDMIVHDYSKYPDDGWTIGVDDAERIVACVNACRPYKTQTLIDIANANRPIPFDANKIGELRERLQEAVWNGGGIDDG